MTPGGLLAWALGGSVVMAVALAAVRCARLSAATRHAILAASLLAQPMLLVPVLTDARLAVPVPDAVVRLLVPDVAPYPGLVVDAPLLGGAAAISTSAGVGGAADPASPRGGDGTLSDAMTGPGPLLLGVWVFVAGGLGARLLVGLVLAAVRIGRCERLEDPAWRRDAELVERRLGLGRVELRISSRFRFPIAAGVLRPRVVLTPSVLHYDRERRLALLMHEMGHVARRDVAVHAALGLVVAAQWFNPLARVVARRARDEAERACDDRVIEAGSRPSTYLLTLVELVRDGGPVPRTAFPFGAEGPTGLSNRAAHILDVPRSRRPLARGTSLAIAGAAAGLAALLGALEAAPAGTAGGASPQVSSPGPTGCAYTGGRHVDRVTVEAGRDVWQVAWDGADCRVDVRATGELVHLGLDRAGAGERASEFGASLLQPPEGATLEIQIRHADRLERVTLTPDSPRPVSDEWLEAFAVELDRHSGFAAALRFPTLRASGGIDGVLAEAGESQGGHAAAPYLLGLLGDDLTPADLERVLDLAGLRVTVQAELFRVLETVSDGHSLDRPSVAAAFQRAARGLTPTNRARLEGTIAG